MGYKVIMNKTLNQRIYEVPGDVKSVIYNIGYKAGKNAILDEIDDILDRCANDNGTMIVMALKELKKTHGVK